jgi:mono/diheme cytochrome c family protein
VSACESRPAPTREWKPEDHVQPQAADPARTPTEAPADAPGGLERAAEALFNVSCASCHGRDGKGQGAGRPPGAQLPDFTSATFQKSQTDEQLAAVIRDGRNMMPPFGKQVNPQGITALVAHIRKLGDSQAAPQ